MALAGPEEHECKAFGLAFGPSSCFLESDVCLHSVINGGKSSSHCCHNDRRGKWSRSSIGVACTPRRSSAHTHWISRAEYTSVRFPFHKGGNKPFPFLVSPCPKKSFGNHSRSANTDARGQVKLSNVEGHTDSPQTHPSAPRKCGPPIDGGPMGGACGEFQLRSAGSRS